MPMCVCTSLSLVLWQVQGELALFLARCASINVEDWGSTNDLILKDAKVLTHKHDLEHRSMSGGRVMIGLVQLLAERVHRRARYHAALCLGNLSDDFMRTVPACVLFVHGARALVCVCGGHGWCSHVATGNHEHAMVSWCRTGWCSLVCCPHVWRF